MKQEFNELERLASPESFSVGEINLGSQIAQFQDASLEEIFDLLEEAMESYTAFAPMLSPELRQSAREEVEFFAWLFQQHLGHAVEGLETPMPLSLLDAIAA